MSNAIEMFRQQRDAADRVHRSLLEVSLLLNQLRQQASALAADKELRTVLRDEQQWLAEARQLVADVRYFRQSEDHRWPARLRRWALPWLFALASALAAGAGYGVSDQRNQDDTVLRSRAAFAAAILERLDGMTDEERRQFDRLMKGSATTR